MFLQPSEVGFLKHLKDARVPLVEFEFPSNRIMNIQSQLEKLIGQNYYLNKASQLHTPNRSISLTEHYSRRRTAFAPTSMHMLVIVFDPFST